MKKGLFLVLTLFMSIVGYAYDAEVDGIYYNLNSENKTAEVTYLKYEKFNYYSNYSGTVDIPEKFTYEDVEYSVTGIGKGAFSDCSNLTSVTIPNSVTSIGDQAFYRCSSLTSITIPNSVTSIGEVAFLSCSGLSSVTIPNSVTTIEQGTFSSCTGLTSVTIPNSVISIGIQAFSGCTGLTSVTIPNSVTNIEKNAFAYCSGLTSVDIPNSVISIGDNAFDRCMGLTSVDIPNSVISIGNQAFYYCLGLTSVTIGKSVTSIGEYAFLNCRIKTITLPENLIVLKNSSFKDCSSLTEVVIPAKVEYIYAEAFAGCDGLKSVTSLAVNPPFCHDLAFSNYNIPLYVPDEAVKSYQETSPWSKFSELKTISGETVENKCATPTISYADKKLTFSCATEGVEYVSEINVADAQKYYDIEVNLSATYEISVYAMKSGYVNSDTATATLVWTEAIFTETTPDTPTSAKAVTENIPVLISTNNGNITVKSEANGQTVSVYSIDGQTLGSGVIRNGQVSVGTSLQSGDVAVVKVGNKSVKVIMK